MTHPSTGTDTTNESEDGRAALPEWVGPDGEATVEPPIDEPTRRIPIRAIRAAVTIVIALGVGFLLFRQAQAIDWSETARELRGANPWFFLVALAAFHLGFLLR